MWLDSVAVLDGKPLKSYTFTENYCFAAGDHVIDSKDSRYFGLIPEKFIVGTAGILWKSHDHRRIFTIIN
ncbi:S26 family signal peptidase [uncultured Duncaniella sp.]|nr:S26 family signal peptidase [uncultured Duncaniella sp.]